VVGVHSDAEIEASKAIPVMTEEERYGLLEHVRWIDEILHDVPYSPQLATLERARAEFAVHGDDMPTNTDGTGTYDVLKNAGMLRIVRRTEGVSTTDLVGRLLTMTRVRLEEEQLRITGKASDVNPEESNLQCHGPGFLATTRRIAEFSSRKVPAADDKIVYVAGDFDMFNVSHARFLERVKAEGTFCLVGVWTDEEVRKIKGPSNPVMSVHERVLNVSACKHVDEVLIGAPAVVSPELISSMNVTTVCEGSDPNLAGPPDALDVPRQLGILRVIEVPMPIISVEDIAQRVAENRIAYVKRNQARAPKERSYYAKADHAVEI
jgi:ethanolamine-phosphate cytidylyltransferase